MDIANYSYSFGKHNNHNVIWIKFPYNKVLIDDLRAAFPAAKWSRSNKLWYLPDIAAIRSQLSLPKKSLLPHYLEKIHPNNKEALIDLAQHLQLKSYSDNTIKTYMGEFAHLLAVIQSFPVQNLTPLQLKSYFLYCLNKLRAKERAMNGKINAIKFYFEQVLHQ